MRADEFEQFLTASLTENIATKNALVALIHALKKSPDFNIDAFKENLSTARNIPVVGIDEAGYRNSIDQFISATK